MTTITDTNIENFISASGFAVICFYASWSTPCVMYRGVIENAEKAYGGKVRFGMCNIFDYDNLIRKFGVESVPLTMVFRNGVKISEIDEAVSLDRLLRILDYLMG